MTILFSTSISIILLLMFINILIYCNEICNNRINIFIKLFLIILLSIQIYYIFNIIDLNYYLYKYINI